MTGPPPLSEGLDPLLKQEFYLINSGTNIPPFCSRKFLLKYRVQGWISNAFARDLIEIRERQ